MKILIVEDEPTLSRLMATALRDVGFAVDTAGDGSEGLAKALRSDYDAIILDLMLPSRSGLSLLKQLRREKRTPTLIVSARDATVDRIEALNEGADDYLVKPFELQELIARTRALIRRSTGQVNPVVAIDDLAVDTRTRIVTVGGKAIDLTPREYALLELFVLHRGKLVTRNEIQEHIFDETEINVSNLIDVHISNLRKKLGRNIITTRRGQGYIIDA